MPKLSTMLLLLACTLLAACGGGGNTTDPNFELLAMHCGDQVAVSALPYRAENNPWGKNAGDVSAQCIGADVGTGGVMVGAWTWDWSNTTNTNDIKAYPEIIFGRKPGAPTTSGALPKRVDSIAVATVSYNVSSVHTGKGNTAFDIWLTNTPNPSAFAAPPITHEIMIWLESYGNLSSSGTLLERVTVDGSEYDVFVADNFGSGGITSGWRYIAFERVTPQLGAASLNVAAFLTYLRAKNLITGSEYLASIEFGNEVVNGVGETHLHSYTVDVR